MAPTEIAFVPAPISALSDRVSSPKCIGDAAAGDGQNAEQQIHEPPSKDRRDTSSRKDELMPTATSLLWHGMANDLQFDPATMRRKCWPVHRSKDISAGSHSDHLIYILTIEAKRWRPAETSHPDESPDQAYSAKYERQT